MISTFHLAKLEALLKDFYTLTQIRITVFDENFQELVAYPAEIAVPCRIIRTDLHAFENCARCDRDACRAAKLRRSPYIYQCHAGFTEAIFPIRMGNIVIGYLFFGHVFAYENSDEGCAQIISRCRAYDISTDELATECKKLPVLSEEYILSASHILSAVASYLCLERMVSLKQQELPAQIDAYITAHLAHPIGIPELCAEFGIGKTKLCEISKNNYGTGLAAHIRHLRIQKAKQLLQENPRISVADVAERCGFGDYNYFISLFKRTTGFSPRAYRTRFSVHPPKD